MNNYITDLAAYRSAPTAKAAGAPREKVDKTQLDMTDFLTLMVKEMTSQSLDSAMDTADMLNQLVQMQMVQAMTNMTDASIMSYAASLVGKEVTVGQYDANGNMQELVGVVTGTGVLGGKQVVFVGDKYYLLSEIMAVGRLPERPDAEVKPDGGEGKPDNGEVKPDGGEVKPDGGTTKPEGGGEVKPGEGGTAPDGSGSKPDQGEKPAEGTGPVG